MTRALTRQGHGGLAKYDPHRGLKTIDAAGAAEKHWARAKDATKLEAAIRLKLEQQADFVLWWDTQGPGKEHGGKRQDAGRKKSR